MIDKIDIEKIKLRNLKVEQPPFRKLKDITVPISERITVIGGHNGIGKSTLIGMIANGSGLRSAKNKSYFDLSFQAVFHELFSLSETYDYKSTLSERGSVTLEYEIFEKESEETFLLEKKCNVTKHKDRNTNEERLKIVPRTVNKEIGTRAGIGNDARVPLPTIYLGMSRVNPIGELDQDTIDRQTARSFDSEDANYYRNCLKEIIDIDLDESDNTMLSHSFKGSKKRSKLPKLKFDSLAISAGQDSLGSILTALASFKRIQRQLGDQYIGGLLVIDEIDAGLHPHAQLKLIRLLKSQAREMKLQIIATTHSLVVMKEILEIDEDQIKKGKVTDTVVYITDSKSPTVMRNVSYQKIESNIFLKRPSGKINNVPTIKVYFEDYEAKYFFQKIIESLNLDPESNFGVKLKLIASKIGCKTLLALAEADDYFDSVMIVFDGDIISEESSRRVLKSKANFLSLPIDIDKPQNAPPKTLNPEMVLYRYIEKLHNDRPEIFWMKTLELGYDGDQIKEHVLNINQYSTQAGKDRDRNKLWFNANKEYFDQVDLIAYWAKDHPKQIEAFINQVKVAIQHLLNQPIHSGGA